MKKCTVLLMLGLIYSFAGCAKYYYQEGKSFEECTSDRGDCFSELKKRMDPLVPSDYAYKFMEDCMIRRGYKLVTESELPLDVKRQDPDKTLYGQLYGYRRGIAGTLDED